MSSFATMYSFGRKYGYRFFVTQEQADLLLYYFQPEHLSLNVIEESQYYRDIMGRKTSLLKWESPWQPQGFPWDVNCSYSKIADPNLQKGRAIDLGDYPNAVQDMVPYLPDIRAKFRLQARFRERAENLLRAEAVRRNMMEAEITWVGVHVRRTDYKHHLDVLYGANLLEADYFKRAMNIYTKDYNNIIFVVVTDDMEWAENNLNEPGFQVKYI